MQIQIPELKLSRASFSLRGIAPYSTSRFHGTESKEGESPEDYDKRTWLNRAHSEHGAVYIPAHGFQQCLVAGAKYSKQKIKGQGASKWASVFTSGVVIPEHIKTSMTLETAKCAAVYCHANGQRGSASRVFRRFPEWPSWTGEGEAWILDQMITPDKFAEMLAYAGRFIGLGRFRPQNQGTNGRFEIVSLEWQDGR